MENFIKYSKLVEKHLTCYIELFIKSISEPAILSSLNNYIIELSEHIVIINNTIKNIKTDDDVFKLSNSVNYIVLISTQLRNTLDFDISRTNHLLSNTAVQILVKQGQLLIRALNNIEHLSYHLYKPNEIEYILNNSAAKHVIILNLMGNIFEFQLLYWQL
jgi:hypothetical protein